MAIRKTIGNGSSPLKSMLFLVNIPKARKKLIAYQSSGGAVSGFIQRYMTANTNNTWAQLKEQLAVRFLDVTDAQMALSLLRRVKQKRGETIQNYSERILSLAEEALIIMWVMQSKDSSLISLQMD